jgi:hypothetical protein
MPSIQDTRGTSPKDIPRQTLRSKLLGAVVVTFGVLLTVTALFFPEYPATRLSWSSQGTSTQNIHEFGNPVASLTYRNPHQFSGQIQSAIESASSEVRRRQNADPQIQQLWQQRDAEWESVLSERKQYIDQAIKEGDDRAYLAQKNADDMRRSLDRQQAQAKEEKDEDRADRRMHMLGMSIITLVTIALGWFALKSPLTPPWAQDILKVAAGAIFSGWFAK